MVFLRVLMASGVGTKKWWLSLSPIIMSMPIFKQSAYGAVEALVVDARTRVLLARPTRLASERKRVSGWHYSPSDSRNEMLRQAMQGVLEAVVAARAAGYPERSAAVEDGAIVSAPWGRQTGQRVEAPGVSFALPTGWSLVSRPGDGVVTAEAPDRTSVCLRFEDTFLGAEDYIEATRRLPSSSPLVSDTPSTLGGRPSQDFAIVSGIGVRAVTRVTSIGGLGLTLRCASPREARSGLICDELLDSVRIDTLAVTEP